MWVRILIVMALLAGLSVGAVVQMTGISDGRSTRSLPPLTPEGQALREDLALMVEDLALKIGHRTVSRRGSMENASEWLISRLEALGVEPVVDEWDHDGEFVANLIVEFEGMRAPREVVLVLAHYDSFRRSPCADASATGTAALIELLRTFKDRKAPRTLRFVLLANGERPWCQTERSGAMRYAASLSDRGERVVAAICLGPLGYYSTDPGSQKFPFPLSLAYSKTGDFVAAFGRLGSRDLVKSFAQKWARNSPLPLAAGILPAWFPGAQPSDHDALHQAGIPALLVSDTGRSRYGDIRTVYDQFHRLDYDRLARVVESLAAVISEFSQLGS